ncbi:M20/M25/M40 family metallo-hydrolase [Candidatus Micrarchaeota archaeon]|nr:M20/M25/M40 family metallo-hydrolase [Candidatus Micrarchaeota archaeon]
MTTSLISGGVAPNIIPGKCNAVIDFRIPPKMKMEKFAEKLKRECSEVEVAVKQVDIGWLENEKSEFVKTAYKVLANITGESRPFMHKMGASDARFYAAAGIPTINVGAGDMKQHVPDEKMNLKQLEQAEKFYCKVAKQIIS